MGKNDTDIEEAGTNSVLKDGFGAKSSGVGDDSGVVVLSPREERIVELPVSSKGGKVCQ